MGQVKEAQWIEAKILYRPGGRIWLHLGGDGPGQRVEGFDTAQEMEEFLDDLAGAVTPGVTAEPAEPALPRPTHPGSAGALVFSAGPPLSLAATTLGVTAAA